MRVKSIGVDPMTKNMDEKEIFKIDSGEEVVKNG